MFALRFRNAGLQINNGVRIYPNDTPPAGPIPWNSENFPLNATLNIGGARVTFRIRRKLPYYLKPAKIARYQA